MEQWWANPQTIGAIGTLIAALVSSLFVCIKDRRSSPIDRKTAELSTTPVITDASRSTIETVLLVNQRIEEDLRENRKKLHAWERWYSNLVSAWSSMKNQSNPPPRPAEDEDE